MKKSNPFLKLLLVFFLIFMALYIALESGYYDVKMGRKATITEEKLEEFENDVKEGKRVDLKDYLNRLLRLICHQEYQHIQGGF